MSAAVLLALGSTALVVVRSGDDRTAAPGAPVAAPSVGSATDVPPTEAAGRHLVAALERAWAAGDRQAFVTAAAPGRGGRRAASQMWAALHALDVQALGLSWVASAVPPPTTPAAGATAAVVEARWDQAGWDGTASTELEVTLGVAEPAGRDSEGRLLDIVPTEGEPAPVWALAPLDVRITAAGARVVGLQGRHPGAGLTRLVDRAVRQVAHVVPPPRPPVVVVAPASAGQFAALIGDSRDYGAVAAVTTTVDGSARGDTGVHVLLNPSVFDRLGPVGARVVLAHEVTHLATGASSTSMPLWVAEGFADFAALNDRGVPVRVAAGRAIAAVRRDGLPPRLPSAADFGTGAPGLGRTYELAWLVFRALDRQVGTRATVRFHDAVVDGARPGRALRSATGIGLDRLTGLWRGDLRRLAGDAG